MQITKDWLLNHGVCVDKFDVYHNGKKLKPRTAKDGYIDYGFHHNSTQYRIRAHVLIYTWYIQNIPEGFEIHHKDRNKANNDIENLEMLTFDEHRERHAGHMGKKMTFKTKMPKKKIYTLEYLDYKIETSKLEYEQARKSKADKKTINRTANKYWGWLNKKKQFTGEI